MVGSNYEPVVYSTRFYSYPPSSSPHGNDWDYLGFIKMTSTEKGTFSSKSKKRVTITVMDKDNNIYLDDKLTFICSGIKAIIKWDQFKQLEIILNEVGNRFAQDEYNKQLLLNGPNNLVCLKYSFDHQLRRFVKLTDSE
jgi:hypothetical protein